MYYPKTRMQLFQAQTLRLCVSGNSSRKGISNSCIVYLLKRWARARAREGGRFMGASECEQVGERPSAVTSPPASFARVPAPCQTKGLLFYTRISSFALDIDVLYASPRRSGMGEKYNMQL